jgi:hypothetical protein
MNTARLWYDGAHQGEVRGGELGAVLVCSGHGWPSQEPGLTCEPWGPYSPEATASAVPCEEKKPGPRGWPFSFSSHPSSPSVGRRMRRSGRRIDVDPFVLDPGDPRCPCGRERGRETCGKIPSENAARRFPRIWSCLTSAVLSPAGAGPRRPK